MLATAIAIQNATQDAVMSDEVMSLASAMYHHKDEMTPDEFARAMFQYSAQLSALTATLVTSVCLTESQLNDLMDTIREMESMGKDITNGND